MPRSPMIGSPNTTKNDFVGSIIVKDDGKADAVVTGSLVTNLPGYFGLGTDLSDRASVAYDLLCSTEVERDPISLRRPSLNKTHVLD